MIATWKQHEGQAVDGIALLRLLGGGESSAVYLAELPANGAPIKLVPTEEAAAQIPLSRWQQASKLTHPHLSRIHQWGRARLDGVSLVYVAMEYAEEELGERRSAAYAQRGSRDADARGEGAGCTFTARDSRTAGSSLRISDRFNDELKISGDAPLRKGERHASSPAPTALRSAGAGDFGSDARGRRMVVGRVAGGGHDQGAAGSRAACLRLPDSLRPDSFREVAAGCLRTRSRAALERRGHRAVAGARHCSRAQASPAALSFADGRGYCGGGGGRGGMDRTPGRTIGGSQPAAPEPAAAPIVSPSPAPVNRPRRPRPRPRRGNPSPARKPRVEWKVPPPRRKPEPPPADAAPLVVAADVASPDVLQPVVPDVPAKSV